jgi:predicted metalloendopeptidase
MKYQIGFPEYITRPESLLIRFSSMTFNSSDFFSNGMVYSKWLLQYYVNLLFSNNFGQEWYMNPAEVNAYYVRRYFGFCVLLFIV